MKRVQYTLATILLVSLSISCSMKSNNSSLKGGGLLWQISGNGLRDTSYLLGTMHDMGHRFLDSIEGFNQILQKVKNVSPEVDLLKIVSGKIVSRTFTPSKGNLPDYMYMPRDTTYKMLYPNDFHFVDSIMKRGNIAYFYYKPYFWEDLFQSVLVVQGIKEKEEPVMDFFIVSSAYKQNKRICPLETVEELSSIDSLLSTTISLQDQADGLLNVLRNIPKMTEKTVELKKIYRKQDLSAIVEYFQKNTELPPKNIKLFYDNFLIGRNKKWMKKLPSIMKEGATLIAVGAGHLIGKEGLIALLRKAGYEVKPVSKK